MGQHRLSFNCRMSSPQEAKKLRVNILWFSFITLTIFFNVEYVVYLIPGIRIINLVAYICLMLCINVKFNLLNCSLFTVR